MPVTGISFRVTVPKEPGGCKDAFYAWLQTRGMRVSEEEVGTNHVITMDAKKFVRQDNLLTSLRNAFKRKGMPSIGVRMTTVKIHGPPDTTVEDRVMQEIAKTKAELDELRRMVGREAPPTTVNNITNNNNNMIILNFGDEDMSYLRPPREYIEKACMGLLDLVKDVYFDKGRPQNHTIRVNVPLCSAEVRMNNAWEKIDLPDASTTMIRKCGRYMLRGFDGELHKENDEVMDFTSSLHSPGEGRTAFVKDEI